MSNSVGHGVRDRAAMPRALMDRTSIAVGVLVSVLVLRVASPTTANLSFAGVALYALLGRAQAVHALGMSWLLTMLSNGLAPEASSVSIARFGVLGVAAFSVFARGGWLRRGMRPSRAVLVTVLLGLFLVAHSAFFSSVPLVSLLKAVSWTVAMCTLIAAWTGLSVERRERLEAQLFGACLILVLVSLPLVASDIGYLRNGTGFQGVLSQPQAFGAAAAVLGSWLLGGLLCDPAPSWRRVILPGGIAVVVVLSESRTAGLALVGGSVLGVLLVRCSSRLSLRRLIPGARAKRLQFGVAATIIAVLIGAPLVSSRISEFVQKRTDSESIVEAYDKARGAKIRTMWDNIQDHPFTGIGFGVASDPSSMALERDAMFGLPTAAVVEKGVMPVAIVEELGVFGALLVVAWLVSLLRKSARGGVKACVVMCTALLTNMGEAALFSPGGFGLVILLVVAWAGTAKPEAETGSPAHA